MPLVFLLFLSRFPLHFVTSHSRVTRLSRSPLCVKRSACGGASPRTTKKVAGLKIKFTFRYFHIEQNAPSSPSKILHNLCFQFLLGITVVPREIEDNGYAKFWGVNKVHCYIPRLSLN